MIPPRQLDFADTYRACREQAVAMAVEHDVVRVTGRDALAYLQTQVSQDLAALGPGDSVESLVLTPKGRIEAYVRVALVGPTDALVVVTAGYGDALLARLLRFKLRVQADLVLVRWTGARVLGPRAGEVVGDTTLGARAVATLKLDWPGMSGLDLVGPLEEPGLLGGAVPWGDPQAFTAVRVEAGEPAMGSEIDERTIAQEVGLVGRAVSMTKGCYPGQELVARIDARGDNVPRRLRGIIIATAPGEAETIAAGASLVREAREVGVLTSVTWSPALDATIGLGYVRRDVEPGSILTTAGDGGACAAEVVELPLFAFSGASAAGRLAGQHDVDRSAAD